jgi:hypothetical protein
MGCRSDYMEPTGYEEQIKDTVNHLVYLYSVIEKPRTAALIKASKDIYFDTSEGDRWVAELCSELRKLDAETFDKVVYNAKVPESRRLADWWEEHEAADNARISAELAKAAKKELRDVALAKLTEEERNSLDLR